MDKIAAQVAKVSKAIAAAVPAAAGAYATAQLAGKVNLAVWIAVIAVGLGVFATTYASPRNAET
jgi:hypothetical protein